MRAVQRSFDDLGSALVDTTFVVVDLETTGGSADSSITEIGAVKVRGGDVLGEFQTLVNPLSPIPPFITALTGITDAMVAGAVTIEEALPSFLEFAGRDAVLVAHNAGFDTRFLRAESLRLGYGGLDHPVVCTVRLARRLVRDEVPNLRLDTLSRALRSRFAPTHRALDDARATTDVFHALLELAGRWGVQHLDDLLWFQTAGGHPQARKRALTRTLPQGSGVYLFVDAQGTILYVGKATDLRARVRSYFSSDDRRRIGSLLREAQDVRAIETRSELESLVLEARLIRRHAPAYNRAGRGRAPSAWIKLTRERFPRLSIARTAPASGAAIGPVPPRHADAIREALESASPIRRCTERIGAQTRFPACALAEMGRCVAPCEGRIDEASYRTVAAPVASALAGAPSDALGALERQMTRLAGERRYEEAATIRQRLGALVGALNRQRTTEALALAGAITVEVGRVRLDIEDGRLVRVDGASLAEPPDGHPDEPRLVAAWLARHRPRVRNVSGSYAMPVASGRELAAWRVRLAAAAR